MILPPVELLPLLDRTIGLVPSPLGERVDVGEKEAANIHGRFGKRRGTRPPH